MNLTKCSNGHFYDSDIYPSCPHCSSPSVQNNTINYQPDDVKTQGGSPKIVETIQKEDPVDISQLTGGNIFPPGRDLDDSKTISIYQTKRGDDEETQPVSPVVGWLVCTKGKSFGKDYRLKSGRNFIGRGSDMDVCLAGENTVSRNRHAIIIHEPRKNIFIAQPGESRELFYVNGDVVLSSIQIKKNDVIQIGDVQLMLVPCCDDAFNWEQGD